MTRTALRTLRIVVTAVVASCLALPTSGAARPAKSRVLATMKISKDGGLGRVEIAKGLAAVLQRDEGIVTLVDVKDPARPKVLGRYDDDARLSLDGDLVFSNDGRWLFYARQTSQFSMEGVHVLDVSDPRAPRLAFYQPAGGTLRIAYHDDGTDEWIVTMDAVDGMVVSRFEPTTGALIPVHVDPLPALKVGGPASAGLFFDQDPMTETTLLYASTGRTGVQVYDFSRPFDPVLVGSWDKTGLAEIEVVTTKTSRTIYAATEYWFDGNLLPGVFVLDATELGQIKQRAFVDLGRPAADEWRVQGMDVSGGDLLIAQSHAGLIRVARAGHRIKAIRIPSAGRNEGAGVLGKPPYTFDVEAWKDTIFVSDAATGTLTILTRD